MNIEKIRNKINQKYDLVLEHSKVRFCNRLTKLVNSKKHTEDKNNEIQAIEMGLTKSVLSKYKESNDYNKPHNIPVPSADTLIRMSDYYNVSIDYLMGLTDYERPVEVDFNNLSEESRKRIVCDYLNLTEESVDILRRINQNRINKLVINDLINDKEVFSAILDYYSSTLLEVFSESDYSQLRTSSSVERKLASLEEHKQVCYANLLDKLPVSRNKLLAEVKSDPMLKLTVAYTLAQQLISLPAALAEIRDNFSPEAINQQSELLKLIKEISQGIIPYGKNRFTIEESIDLNKSEFNDILDSVLTSRDSYDSSEEDDEYEFPELSNIENLKTNNKDVTFTESTVCGLRSWKIESKKDDNGQSD